MAKLDDLAPELVLMIMSHAHSPQDLHAFICAHPHCFHIWVANRRQILANLVRSLVPSEALRTAIFVSRIPSARPHYALRPPQSLNFRRHNTSKHDELMAESCEISKEYFSRSEPAFPTDMATLTNLTRLVVDVCRFTEEYTHRASILLTGSVPQE